MTIYEIATIVDTQIVSYKQGTNIVVAINGGRIKDRKNVGMGRECKFVGANIDEAGERMCKGLAGKWLAMDLGLGLTVHIPENVTIE